MRIHPTDPAAALAASRGVSAPFFLATDHLGDHAYFRSEEGALSWRAAFGGRVLETTPRRIWRSTQT